MRHRDTIRNRMTAMGLMLALALAVVAPPATARERRVREVHQSRAELSDDRRDTRDDWTDLNRLDQLVDDWHAAWASGDRGAEQLADNGIERWLAQELRESRHEVGEARREVSSSAAEVRHERRDVAATPHGRAGHVQRTELRDDRHDLRDDKRDLFKDQADLKRTREIARELALLQPAFATGTATHYDYDSKSALLIELQDMARRELKRDKQETREDQRERVEDRRDN